MKFPLRFRALSAIAITLAFAGSCHSAHAQAPTIYYKTGPSTAVAPLATEKGV